ncbi:MAG: phosphate signaling complex protein PhoU [Thermodesulfobacteriota bacterium]|jgi:phosphate transport system protein|nr:phosphate signaling complex protein PhoU [Thermodesulfobacteriota bacterium]|tara:strand:- start:50 stop:706 length:657 start_codon:yes stop_codon:yes gene_type:complete
MTELEKRIDNIRHALVKMASIVETNINNSIKCLTERNKSLSDEIFTQELEVDKLDNEIDTQGIETLALFQPVSEDLRYVVMAMKINKDLERIGDHAVGITRKAVDLLEFPTFIEYVELPKMAFSTSKMVSDSIKSFISGNKQLAIDVCERDREIDKSYIKISEEIISLMKNDSSIIDGAKFLLLILKDIERIGDLATNIAEDSYYIQTGTIIRHGNLI